MADDIQAPVDEVRAQLAEAEPVDMPEGLSVPEEAGANDPMPWERDAGDPGAADPGAGAPPDRDDALADLLAQCARLPLNDFGNGQRFELHFGGDVLWVPRVGWFVWTGQRWIKDKDEIEVRRRAQQLGRLISDEIPHVALEDWQAKLLAEEAPAKARLREIADLEDGSEEAAAAAEEREKLEAKLSACATAKKALSGLRREHRSFARTSGNTTRIGAALAEAAVSLARAREELDAAALDVNTESGVLRFSVSGGGDEGYSRTADVTLIPHERGQYMTKLMPVTYDPGAEAPLFRKFLNRVQPDAKMQAFLQRWLGLSMSALTGEQKLSFWYGDGSNGKSVLADLIARMMGDYASTAKIESLTGSNRRGGGDATPDLVPLMGARFVRAAEPDQGEKLQEGLLKELTGGEPLLIRALHSDFIEERPVFKLTISGNHKPEIRGTDDGIWRRILLVPFDVKIPPEERDPDLVEKLWAERSGILNWLVDGLMAYLEGGLQEPEAVLEATKEYREESDPIGQFLEDVCVVTGDTADSLRSRDLSAAFSFWMHERAGGQWREGTVTRRIREKSRVWNSPKTGQKFTSVKSNGTMRYSGIRFSEVFKAILPMDEDGKVIWEPKRQNG